MIWAVTQRTGQHGEFASISHLTSARPATSADLDGDANASERLLIGNGTMSMTAAGSTTAGMRATQGNSTRR